MPCLTVLLMLLGLVAGCSTGGQGAPAGARVPHGSSASGVAAAPEIRVAVLAAGLEHMWNIGFLPTGQH